MIERVLRWMFAEDRCNLGLCRAKVPFQRGHKSPLRRQPDITGHFPSPDFEYFLRFVQTPFTRKIPNRFISEISANSSIVGVQFVIKGKPFVVSGALFIQT